MLDRASTFADPEIVKLLKTEFIPVAIDQWYHRRQDDTEGEFFRKIAEQSAMREKHTKQGLYAVSPNGKLIGFTNHRSPERVRAMLKSATTRAVASADPMKAAKVDPRYNPVAPKGGLIVRVNAKVMGGYAAAKSDSEKIFQTALSRDNLWITKAEHKAIVAGKIPNSLQRRIARFHLVDNTRGEPPMWADNEIVSCSMNIEGKQLTGDAHLRTADGAREFKCQLLGIVETNGKNVTRLDIVAKGSFRGEGRYTKRAPKGEFPLAIAFRIADMKEPADRIPPQASRGWPEGYLKLK